MTRRQARSVATIERIVRTLHQRHGGNVSLRYLPNQHPAKPWLVEVGVRRYHRGHTILGALMAAYLAPADDPENPPDLAGPVK